MNRLISLAIILLIASCTPYRLIPAGKVEFADQGTVETPIDWNWRPFDIVHTWTLDGPNLQEMIFHMGVKDGKTLMEVLDVEAGFHPLLVWFGKVPDEVSFRFHKRMTEHEIVDLFTASMSKIAGSKVVSTQLAPATLGGKPGFRFEYAFTGKDQVRRKGFGVGAVFDEKLYLIHYVGTEIYYYDRNQADAERIIQSFTFKEKDKGKG
ncbi:hypothetical protein [Magnetospirillum moscoviense]|uniref:Lipoprotein n=1 Tax=Magnetospirillum moscoviense TaxID=1437059 RepID=A0A178M7C5_9PROT|nr:hypothetical protein [Magnetospirillum moscoviense]OAN44660.1 hypothetical protein A6A05_17355 [Magnetospirillum moscoviense]